MEQERVNDSVMVVFELTQRQLIVKHRFQQPLETAADVQSQLTEKLLYSSTFEANSGDGPTMVVSMGHVVAFYVLTEEEFEQRRRQAMMAAAAAQQGIPRHGIVT